MALRRVLLFAALSLLAAPIVAHAGAWPYAPGVTQAILKSETGRADEGFDASGRRIAIPGVADDDLSLFVEHGITSRLTFQGQIGATRGDDGFTESAGRGPLSAGLRFTPFVLEQGREVISLYAGATLAGEGRNAAYSRPDQGHYDGELRVLYGRSALVFGREGFVDVEAARLLRDELADETHVDLTLGYEVKRRWLVLAQAYAGQADTKGVQPRWLKLELGLVRQFGSWRVQGGWRDTVAGRNTPIEGGPVFALWRIF